MRNKPILWLLCVTLNSALSFALSGSGTEADPYLIQSRADFEEFANPANAAIYWASFQCTKLMCDLNLADTPYTQAVIAPDTSTSSGFQGTSFKGVFDGNGHIISNLTITASSKDYIGFFGHIGSGGQVTNVGIEDVSIAGGYYVGGLAGLVGDPPVGNYALINGCYVTGSVSGTNDVGGVIGLNTRGAIADCHMTGSATGFYSVGGLVGRNGSSITSCYATASATGTAENGHSHVGGLVGENSGSITSCYATGAVIVTEIITQYFSMTSSGGLVGRNSGTVTSCYAAGSVSGYYNVGGLAGLNYASITNCYSTGLVSSTRTASVGGLVGHTESGSATASFWDTQSSGRTTSAGGTGKTTAEMKTLSTFTSAGWDFSYTDGDNPDWWLPASRYPRLAWEPGMVWYSGGDGTAGDPYRIANVADFQELSAIPAHWSKCLILTADIDLSGLTFTHAPLAPNMSTPFSGVFDGNGHTLSNLTIVTPLQNYIGLFGYVSPGGQIRNLGIVNADLTGKWHVGGIVGWNQGTVTCCYADGSVYSSDASNSYVGGLVGTNGDSGVITSCYATCSVTGSTCAGGMAGSNSGILNFCYAAGPVTGTSSNVGGLAGYNSRFGSIIACVWDMQISGQTDSAGGKGLATEQMKTISLYQNAGWADRGWEMIDGVDYPRLIWENTGGDEIPAAVIPFTGNGTPEDPYLITTAQEFAAMSWYSGVLNKHTRLTADLDLSGIALCPLGRLGPLTGVFDGNNRVIRNAVINEPSGSYVGLFSCVGSGGQVKNLGVENINLTGSRYIGGLAGRNSGTLTVCHVTGSVAGTISSIGGLAGYNDGSLVNCFTIGSVTGPQIVGGLVGDNFYGTLTGCYATGSVKATNIYSYVGGLVGKNGGSSSSIICCHTSGLVNGNMYVGGLVGNNGDSYNSGGQLTSSCSLAQVFGGSSVGGLAGSNSGALTCCYANGPVAGTHNVGGLIGFNYTGPISYSYSTGKVTGTSNVGGLCGFSNTGGNYADVANFWDTQTSQIEISSMGTHKTTSQMMAKSTFIAAGWNFEGDVPDWMMLREGEDYPRLSWQPVIESDIAGLYGVNVVDYEKIAEHWGQTGCPNECENSDINGDGTIDMLDLMLLTENWLEGLQSNNKAGTSRLEPQEIQDSHQAVRHSFCMNTTRVI